MRNREGADLLTSARQLQAERDHALGLLERARHENEALRRAQRDDAERGRAAFERAQARVAEVEAAYAALAAAPPKPEPDGSRVEELLGDLANVRRRRDLDVAAAVKAEQIRLLVRLTDVRDTVHWALAASPDERSAWHVGLVGIRDQIDRQLRAEGAAVFGAVGEDFDPRLHEALGAEDRGAPGTLTRVEAPGVRLDDGTVVRPARVMVSASEVR